SFAAGLTLPLRPLNELTPPLAPSPTRFQLVPLLSQMNNCRPAGASALTSNSLLATQLAGVLALRTVRTGRVAPAALKSCVPAVKVFDAASLASPALTLLMLVCKLATSFCRVVVSAL